ncbi:glycerol-3-phosphate 1-O-acyltransferase PlsY [Thermosyntropha sp.]|uniref:glycerol-3-phosphate 1-O-acyltransferase PlsY n=1 Tax=Thermosyntropha sp. TaxID=2740820 RepID=UPI0025D8DBB9|nr:glycerol-3-phosphate 1-O-acyltransferase PlsY [Thermosyntropha sp.]MBO8159561.1 glycerol-3-phosphate 1-O-acyltransferase PlsY [Thermosyntropha sp.]
MQNLGVIVLCYLIGSIPFSFIFSRLWGEEDIRKKGSGNVGATNVLRTAGIKAALPALIGDLLKGIVAAFLGMKAGGEVWASVCAAAAVIGHCYPVFLRFKGGKGVATAGGVVLFLMPKILGILALIFIVVVIISRYVSLGSIIAAFMFPIMAIVLDQPLSYIILSVFLAFLVIYKHRENIMRLRQGKELKLGQKA